MADTANAVPLLTQARPATHYDLPLFGQSVNIFLTNFETIAVSFVSLQLSSKLKLCFVGKSETANSRLLAD